MSDARATERSDAAGAAPEPAAIARAGAGPESFARSRDVTAALTVGDAASRARVALALQRACGNAALQRMARRAPKRTLARTPGDALDLLGGAGSWLEAERARRAELEAAETGEGRRATLARLAAMDDREARRVAAGIAYRAQDRGDSELAVAASARLLRAWLAGTDRPGTFSSAFGPEDAVDTLLERADRALAGGAVELGGNYLAISLVQLVRAARAAVLRRFSSDDPALQGLGEALAPLQRDQEREVRQRIERARGLLAQHGQAARASGDAAGLERFERMAESVQIAERRAGPAIAEDLGEIGEPESPARGRGGARRGPAATTPATPPPRPAATPQAPLNRAAEEIVNATHPDLEGALVMHSTAPPTTYGNIRSPRHGVAGTLEGAHRMASELFGRRSAVIVEDVHARSPDGAARQIRYLVLALNVHFNPPNPALGEGGAVVGFGGVEMLARPASRRYFFLAVTAGPWLLFSPPLLDYLGEVRRSERREREAGIQAPTLDPATRRAAVFGPIDRLIAAGETQEAANALTYVGRDGFALLDATAKARYVATLLDAFTYKAHEETIVEVFRSVSGPAELRTILQGVHQAGVIHQLHSDMENAFPSLLIAVGQSVGARALTAAQARRLMSELRLFSPLPGIEVRADGSLVLRADFDREFVTAIEQLLATLSSAVTGIVDILMDPPAFVEGLAKLVYFVLMAKLAADGHPEAIRYVTTVVDGVARHIGAATRGLAALQENMPQGVEFVRDLQRAVEWRIVWEVLGLFVGVGEAVAFVDAIKAGRAAAAVAEVASGLNRSRQIARGAGALEEASEAGRIARGAETLEEASEAGRIGRGAAGREGREAAGDAGRAGRAADEVVATREMPNGARLRYRADGRRILCINPCAELSHLTGVSDELIETALRNLPQGRTKEFVETLAHFKGVDEIPEIEKLVTALSKGGDEAASATDLIDRLAGLRSIDMSMARPGQPFTFNLKEVAEAHARGDAILAHGPLQTPRFLEDITWGGERIGRWELHSGQLHFPGRRSLSEHRLPDTLEKLDFVIIEGTDGRPSRLILGFEHSGLSGERPFVYAAGEMRFSPTGELIGLTRQSGHYRPAERNLERAREFLAQHNMVSPRGLALDPL